jgi:hypothetical protein
MESTRAIGIKTMNSWHSDELVEGHGRGQQQKKSTPPSKGNAHTVREGLFSLIITIQTS